MEGSGGGEGGGVPSLVFTFHLPPSTFPADLHTQLHEQKLGTDAANKAVLLAAQTDSCVLLASTRLVGGAPPRCCAGLLLSRVWLTPGRLLLTATVPTLGAVGQPF